MNAISFLLKEHEKVRTVFAEIMEETHRMETKKKMFADFSPELVRHETMEETIWYPLLSKNEDLQKIIEHLITEEKAASKTIKELQHLNDDDKWLETFKKLKKDVEHHADEEESKLFPKVKKLLDDKTLEEIGKEMYDYKQAHQK